ncbi:MAG TPA: PEGA domain-containing protein [Polyangia bacterium]|nr:PEGA domain-containing protein [Polyangia bacterium]
MAGAEGDDARLGQVLGDRYRLTRRLEAREGLTRYRAERTAAGDGGDVDVEIIDVDARADVARALEDARTVARVGHDGVAQILHGGRAPDGAVFFAVEALEGTDLAQLHAAEPPLPWDRAQNILLQIAAALDAQRRHGIAHGALGASSVRLTARDGRRDVVKLRDFGVARLRGGEDDDVRALATLAYRMVTGRRPEGAPPAAPSSLRPSGTLPADLDAVVLRGLDANPARAWPDLASFSDALARCRLTRRQSVRVEALAAAERTNRAASGAFEAATRRRHRVLSVASVAAAVLLAIGGLHFLLSSPGHVQITTVPADATLTFNGLPVPARSPVTLDAAAGRYVLVVARAGFRAETRAVDVEASKTTEVSVELVADSVAP